MYGWLMLLAGIVIIYLKYNRKWIYKNADTNYEHFLSVYGWAYSILMIIAGVFLLFD